MTAAPRYLREGDPEVFVDRLLAWCKEVGSSHYDDTVSQAEHALQTAWLAREAGAPPTLVVAALFHDIAPYLDELTWRCRIPVNSSRKFS